ncbi:MULTISPECIES: sigma-70 family RNA polymerase sigma factor [Cupriavidus]
MDRTTDQGALQRREAHLQSLFANGLAGDQAAYARFLAELATLLRGYLRNRLRRQPEDVEDLTQEVLLAVHNARHTYLPGQPLTAWVHAIARYKLADHFRAHARHDALNDPLDEAHELLAAPDLEPAQARRDLNVLLDALPDKQRLPIVHVKLEGLSVSEAARMTGLSESAVKVGVHRGLKALAAKMRGTR